MTALPVEPEPLKGSSIVPPLGVTNLTKYCISSVGFTVGCVFFLTGPRTRTFSIDLRDGPTKVTTSFDANSRPCGTVKHGANYAYNDVNNDTSNFFESNTNLQKGLAMLEKLVEYGVPFDRTKNQENENPHRIGAALDLRQNIVMSRVKSGVAPAYVDYTTHETPAETDYYDRSLSEVAAEVEFNNFDVFVSIHSNALTDGTNTNFPLILYRGTDDQEGNAGSIAMGKALWPHLYGLGHQQWTAYDLTKTNIRGDHTFYGSTSTVKYEITDSSYIYDTTDQFSQFIEATDTTPAYVAYTGYLGVIKHACRRYVVGVG